MKTKGKIKKFIIQSKDPQTQRILFDGNGKKGWRKEAQSAKFETLQLAIDWIKEKSDPFRFYQIVNEKGKDVYHFYRHKRKGEK